MTHPYLLRRRRRRRPEEPAFQAYCDGSCIGNPGPMAIGGVVSSPDGEVVREFSAVCGFGTSMDAEYMALLRVLRELRTIGARRVCIHMDARTVVEQVSGRARNRVGRRESLLWEAVTSLAAARRRAHVDLIWIPREYNRQADRLANAALRDPVAGIDEGERSGNRYARPVAPAPHDVPAPERPTLRDLARDEALRGLPTGRTARKRRREAIAARFGRGALDWLDGTVPTWCAPEYRASIYAWCARGLEPVVAIRKAAVDRARRGAEGAGPGPGGERTAEEPTPSPS